MAMTESDYIVVEGGLSECALALQLKRGNPDLCLTHRGGPRSYEESSCHVSHERLRSRSF